MRPIGQADRGRGAGDLFNRDDMGQIAHACAAVIFLDRDAQKAQIAHLAPQRGGKGVGAVDGGGLRFQPVLRPGMDHVAQRLDVGAQIEPQRCVEHRGLA